MTRAAVCVIAADQNDVDWDQISQLCKGTSSKGLAHSLAFFFMLVCACLMQREVWPQALMRTCDIGWRRGALGLGLGTHDLPEACC